MNTLLRPRLLLLLAALVPVTLMLQPANVDAQTRSVRPPQAPSAHMTEKEKMNAWTVNRRWIGTPYRHPKGTPLSGEFGR
jgi:hypothetical protein